MYLRKNANQKAEVKALTSRSTRIGTETSCCFRISSARRATRCFAPSRRRDRQLLTTAVSRLSERERRSSRCASASAGGEEKTQKEVADYLGISQSYISRLEKRIIARLKREILKMS